MFADVIFIFSGLIGRSWALVSIPHMFLIHLVDIVFIVLNCFGITEMVMVQKKSLYRINLDNELALEPNINAFFCHKCCWYYQENSGSSILSLHAKESSVIQASFLWDVKVNGQIPFFCILQGMQGSLLDRILLQN